MSPKIDHATLDRQLNEQIKKGDIMNAFETYYADDVVMQENLDEPRSGKANNRAFEKQFMDSVAEWHRMELLSSAVNGNIAFSEWAYEVTFKNGTRINSAQVAVRRWKDGKISHERFYHKQG
jgi:ketosteroid isomerase-like protein